MKLNELSRVALSSIETMPLQNSSRRQLELNQSDASILLLSIRARTADPERAGPPGNEHVRGDEEERRLKRSQTQLLDPGTLWMTCCTEFVQTD